MEQKIRQIIKEAACVEEVWVTVEDMFDDAGVNYLFSINFPQED